MFLIMVQKIVETCTVRHHSGICYLMIVLIFFRNLWDCSWGQELLFAFGIICGSMQIRSQTYLIDYFKLHWEKTTKWLIMDNGDGSVWIWNWKWRRRLFVWEEELKAENEFNVIRSDQSRRLNIDNKLNEKLAFKNI